MDILDAIPRSRINDVCYLDAGETEYPVGFNPATRIAPERRALAASGIVAAFKHLWSDSWGAATEHFLCHGVTALISREHATLIDLPRLYTDDNFREHVLRSVSDPETLRFWHGGISELHEIAPLRRGRADPEQSRTVHRLAALAAHPRPGRSALRSRVRDEQPPHPHREPGQGNDRGAGGEPLGLASRLAHAAGRDGARRAPAASNAFHFSCTSTSSRRSVPMRSPRFSPRRANSPPTSASRINTPISYRTPCARP